MPAMMRKMGLLVLLNSHKVGSVEVHSALPRIVIS